MPDCCPSLAKANASRRRAWGELQRIRRVLETMGEVPPTPKPVTFEAERAILERALVSIIEDLICRLAKVSVAGDKLREFALARGAAGDVAFPGIVMEFNEAQQAARQAIDKRKALQGGDAQASKSFSRSTSR